MAEQVEIRVVPEELSDHESHRKLLAGKLGLRPDEIQKAVLKRRSLDARRGKAEYLLRFEVYRQGDELPAPAERLKLKDVRSAPEVVIIGCGPAGLFAALRLIELGLRPVLLERGKAVRDRRRDIAKLTKYGVVNPDSNYCFGEGGAGTFSDGKLYTRSNKRGSIERVLQIFAANGADPDILIDAHPHIGTNRLPAVVESIRDEIRAHGGVVAFDQRAVGIESSSGSFIAVRTAAGERYGGQALILAAGHSARDVFTMVHHAGLTLEKKPFAIGVRVEHPQELIDSIQYGCSAAARQLPPASYALRAQALDRGVFSFCMCPGGIICPAATAPDEIVVNGWSPSKRNSRFANSGIVVEIPVESIAGNDIFSGVRYQQAIEQAAAAAGGGKQAAPAARLTDFLAGKVSSTLPESSYLPGTHPAELREILPIEISSRLAEGFKSFGKKVRGYLTEEAILLAPESRTSSPIRIPRDNHTLMHPNLNGLFPCGEGAGYAGGIVSAAMDGTLCAEAVGRWLSGI